MKKARGAIEMAGYYVGTCCSDPFAKHAVVEKRHHHDLYRAVTGSLNELVEHVLSPACT
jgi:hypothetical protein